MTRAPSWLRLVACVTALLLPLPAALADHSNPREEQASTEGDPVGQAEIRGEGTWEFLRNFKANPGTDLFLFRKKGQKYSSSGTLGQAEAEHVGQRIIRLVDAKGEVAPQWIADHGSAHCPTANPSGTTGLQHDVQATPKNQPKLLIDATDASGRCHDPGGGGLEFIDISGLHKEGFEPREVHLTRHVDTSHNVTVDATRPWVVYNSSSTFNNTERAFIDILDIRSCLLPNKVSLKEKRRRCRPKVFRMNFQPGWTANVGTDGEPIEGYDSSCHDIVARPGRIYCAGLSGTAIFDVSKLTDRKTGAVKGKPLACEVIDGTTTTAKVTDCSQAPEEGVSSNQAAGWRFAGAVNHVGRDCGGGPTGPNNCNNNIVVPSREGVAVSHEAVPTWDKKYMFVTDERGGGVVPGGATCDPQNQSPYSNGGVHVFDISDPGKVEYAMTPDDQKAVFIGEVVVPHPTFCTAHRMQLMRGEQRFVIAWYSQGTKIVDYFIDAQGRWTFRETASIVFPGANTWTTMPFKKVTNEDGTKTYWFVASDIGRGVDIFSWTGPPNPKGTPPPGTARPLVP